MKKGTWELIPPPKGSKIIGNKCVFRTKLKGDRTLDKYKSRVVAKGFQQTKGMDYTETFNLLVKLTTIHNVLAWLCLKSGVFVS